jgi:hypothetical protein
MDLSFAEGNFEELNRTNVFEKKLPSWDRQPGGDLKNKGTTKP